MTRVLLVGASGHMGRTVAKCADNMPDIEIVAGVDVQAQMETGFPIFPSLGDVDSKADVVIDFSSPNSLDGILQYCEENATGAVLATTGYDEAQLEQISRASATIPIFRAPNFSIGIALLNELTRHAAQVLANRFDVEIVERHHNRKSDAPSGTALSIVDVLTDIMPGSVPVFGRHGREAARQPGEIGVHAVRGGGLVGDHEVMFLSEDEELYIAHRAYSRDIFAEGALAAARFLDSKKSGLYGMRSLLSAMGLRSHDSSEV